MSFRWALLGLDAACILLVRLRSERARPVPKTNAVLGRVSNPSVAYQSALEPIRLARIMRHSEACTPSPTALKAFGSPSTDRCSSSPVCLAALLTGRHDPSFSSTL